MTNLPTLIDVNGKPLRASRPQGRFLLGGSSGFEGARADRQQTRGWSTAPVASTSETLWGRAPMAARARDLVRNNGKAKGAQDKQVNRIVGKGRRFRSRPDAVALGISREEARALGKAIERELKLWGSGMSRQCDIAREMSWGQIQRVLYAERKTAGECLALMRWRPERVERDGLRYATCVQAVDPERLSNPRGQSDRVDFRQGIQFDEDGAPVAYHIQRAHPADAALGADRYIWDAHPRFDEFGNWVVIHGFDADRSEQVRGISGFAAILLAFRDVQRYSEAEIGAAVINALFAAFVESGFDPLAVAETMGLDAFDIGTGTSSWQSVRANMLPDNLRSAFADNGIWMLPPGDKVSVPNQGRQTGNFDAFVDTFDRHMAVGFGMDPSSFSGNMAGVNYSALRYFLLDAWQGVNCEAGEFDDDTLLPILSNVITEAFDRGYVTEPAGAPSFDEARDAYLAGRFIGPGKPIIDPVKEEQADAIAVANGFRSPQMILAERGLDEEEVLDDLADWNAMLQAREITVASLTETGAVQGGRQE